MDDIEKEILRDSFAIAALTGILSGDYSTGVIAEPHLVPQVVAEMSYMVADEMMKARNA